MLMQWKEETKGIFTAESPNFHLKIQRRARDRSVRFTVERHNRSGTRALIGSGSLDSLGQAMEAAEAMAWRMRSQERAAELLVMIVAGDGPAREAIARSLRHDGFEVVEAKSAEGGLRRLERISRRTLLLTDADLGAGMSGVELVATAREFSLAAAVLLMSDDGTSGDVPSSAHCHASPASLRTLLDRVAAVARGMPRGDIARVPTAPAIGSVRT